MKAHEIKPGIFWVGGKDSKLREFHGYKTHRGTSYNAYLIKDKKTVLVDSVKQGLRDDMIDRLKSIVDISTIDYIVCNHVEMDHSGVIPEIAKLAPNAEIIASPNGDRGLHEHYFSCDLKIRTVKHGETISIGKRTLQFFHTAMVHWPDSMATYIPEDKLLLPNDAFGQHYSSEKLFYDECPREIVLEEAAKYYANIVLPYGAQVMKALTALSAVEIDMIAPSHGVIWRRPEDITHIVNKYKEWANHETQNRAVIVYDTMWKSTRCMAKAVLSAFEERDIPVRIISLQHTHYSDVLTEILEAKYVLVGTPNLNNQMLPTVASFLTYTKGLQPKNRISYVFGSYGWSPKVFQDVETLLKEDLGWTLPKPPFKQKYIPKEEDLMKLKETVLSLIDETSNT